MKFLKLIKLVSLLSGVGTGIAIAVKGDVQMGLGIISASLASASGLVSDAPAPTK